MNAPRQEAVPKSDSDNKPAPEPEADDNAVTEAGQDPPAEGAPKEIGGRNGPEPTRYGDWEKSGRCIDF